MSWYREAQLQEEINKLKKRVDLLEGNPPADCPMCGVAIDDLFDGRTGVVCSRADCCRRPRGPGTAI